MDGPGVGKRHVPVLGPGIRLEVGAVEVQGIICRTLREPCGSIFRIAFEFSASNRNRLEIPDVCQVWIDGKGIRKSLHRFLVPTQGIKSNAFVYDGQGALWGCGPGPQACIQRFPVLFSDNQGMRFPKEGRTVAGIEFQCL